MWLTNASYLTSAGALRHGDIAVEDGVITEIAPPSGGRAEAVDCTGHLIIPGLVNGHFHSQSTVLRGVGLGAGPVEGAGDGPDGRLARRVLTRLDHEAGPDGVTALARKEYLDQLRQGVTFVADSGTSDLGGPLLADTLDELGLRGSVELYDGADTTAERPDRQRYSVHLPEEEDLTPDTVRTAADRARRAHRPGAPPPVLTTHSLETDHRRRLAADTWGRSSVDVLADHALLGPGTVLFHGCTADAADLAAVADAGAALVHCPVSNLGTAARPGRTAAWLDAGVRTALGTDWADTDLWGTARAAWLLLAAQGVRGPHTPARVLRMATRDGALAYGRDDLGEIAVGRTADLVLLDVDALGPVTEADGVSTAAHAVLMSGGVRAVRHVMIGGRWVLRAGEPVHADARDVARAYRALAASLTA